MWCSQDLKTAVKRKAEPQKPSFNDEPLEAQKLKRPRVPVTPILPPGSAQGAAKLGLTTTSRPAPDASTLEAATVKEEDPLALSAGPAAADQADQSLQKAAHAWPSQAPNGRTHKAEAEGANIGPQPEGAVEQLLEVQELEWKPEEAAGSSADHAQEAVPAELEQRMESTAPRSQARHGPALCWEPPEPAAPEYFINVVGVSCARNSYQQCVST